jgi:hypothetical protein
MFHNRLTQCLAVVVFIAGAASVAGAQDSRRRPVAPPAPRIEKIKKFLDEHPGMKARLESWRALSPEQRREKIQQKAQEWRSLTQDEKKARISKRLESSPFLKEHPELKARIDEFRSLTPEQKKERIQQKRAEWKALTPEQRKEKIQAFRAEHPHFGKRLLRAHRMHKLSRILKTLAF